MSNFSAPQDWSVPPHSVSDDSGFDFVGMLQRRFWIVITCIMLATGCGAYWYWKSDISFTSNARAHIYFQNPNVSFIGKEGFATTNTIRSHGELIRSESVLLETAFEITKLIQKNRQRQSGAGEDNSATVGSESGSAKDQQTTNDFPANTNADPDRKAQKPVQAEVNDGLQQKKNGEPGLENQPTDLDWVDRVPFGYLADKTPEQIRNHLLGAIDISQDRDDPNIYRISYTGPDRKDCHVILGMLIKKYAEHLNSKYENEGQEVLRKIGEAQQNISKELVEKQNRLKRWRMVEKVDLLKRYAEGFQISEEGIKSNRFRVEAQQLYASIQSMERDQAQWSDEKTWIQQAVAANMSKQEILTHINKFSEWLQIEQRKNDSAAVPANDTQSWESFQEPDLPDALIQARFAVITKKLEAQDLIDRGFGENFPGRRKIDSELALLETKARLLEEAYQKNVQQARAAFEERKKQVEAVAEEDLKALPEILSEIDLIGLHASYLDQKLIRLKVDLDRSKLQREEKLAKAQVVDVLLSEERELENEIQMLAALNKTILQKIQEVNIEKDNGGYALDVINSPSYANRPSRTC